MIARSTWIESVDRGVVPESSLGHHYQSWWALLLLWEASRKIDPDAAVRIERLDDVSIEQDNANPLEAHQTKTHKHGVLADKSVDLWKTLRQWIAMRKVGIGFQRLCLVTTQPVAPDSGAALLRAELRNVQLADEKLYKAAKDTTNKANEAGRLAFLALKKQQRIQFLESVFILDRQGGTDEIRLRLLRELNHVAGRVKAADAFLMLLGWWEDRVVNHLKARSTDRITGLELQIRLDDIREQFFHRVLKIDPDVMSLMAPEGADAKLIVLVEQLKLIALENEAVAFAIHDYHRAYIQTSRWVERALLRPDELAFYEKRLVDEWNRYRAFHLPEARYIGKTDDELAELGREAHQRLTDRAIRLLDHCEEPFICRGTYYKLSDEPRIGWHPDFVNRLRDVLVGRSA